jgi:hypothetical protein
VTAMPSNLDYRKWFRPRYILNVPI